MPGTQQPSRIASQLADQSEALTLRLRETAAWRRIRGGLSPYLAALGRTVPDDLPPVLADVLVRLSVNQPWAQAWAPAAHWITRRASQGPDDPDLVANLLAAAVFAFQRQDPRAAAPAFATLVTTHATRTRPASDPLPDRGTPAAGTATAGARPAGGRLPGRAIPSPRAANPTGPADQSANQRVAAYQASQRWAQVSNIIEPVLSTFEENLPVRGRWAIADVLSRLAANQPSNEAFKPTADWIAGLREAHPATAARFVELLALVVRAARPQDREAAARVQELVAGAQGRPAGSARTDTSTRASTGTRARASSTKAKTSASTKTGAGTGTSARRLTRAHAA